MKNTKTKDFISYEYLSVNVRSSKEPFYVDSYEAFGWNIINNSRRNGLVDKDDYYINNANINGNKLVNIKFKRDRKINNKSKLDSLQKKFEQSIKELEIKELEPKKKSTLYSIVIGLIGCIPLAISVFAVSSSNPNWIICWIFGIIGLILWVLPYFIYKNIRNKLEEKNMNIIDEKYKEIYDICTKAGALLQE